MVFHEHWHRSAIKAVSYRIFAVIIDLLVAYFFTRKVGFSIGIVIFVDGYSTVLYYLHERLWNRIRLGRVSHEMIVFHEHWKRSAVKALSYRLLSVAVDLAVAYAFTREAVFSLGLVAFVDGYSTVLYYLHERLWNSVHIGKSKATPVRESV